jgi:hypothetical protein
MASNVRDKARVTGAQAASVCQLIDRVEGMFADENDLNKDILGMHRVDGRTLSLTLPGGLCVEIRATVTDVAP